MMERTLNISFIYGIDAVLALLLACGYCAIVRKKEIWLIWLYFSVFVANIGYFALSISKTVEEALLANRLAYLGCVFLPLFMLMTIMKVCKVHCAKVWRGILIGLSCIVFLIAASQGYLPLYYKEVSIVFVNGMAKLQKVYGPLHGLYYLYLFAYFAIMIGVIVYAVCKKKISSYKHAMLLLVVVFFNIAIWLIEQFINWDFEFLSVSYIASELLLFLLYGMIQDYEEALSKGIKTNVHSPLPVIDWDSAQEKCPAAAILSNREKDVFMKMLEDKKRKEIAEELCITENTVKKHVSSIFAKLDIASRDELFEKLK
ncbi:MAG: hypothetical protein IKJ15_01145 [Lachnospiraceae bacterium]|nr:hypothetical protein [Lachnospiraceae bacterium]